MGTQFYRGFVVIPTDLILRSKYLWGWLWLTMDRVKLSRTLTMDRVKLSRTLTMDRVKLSRTLTMDRVLY
ncbi:hypothetical protein LEP1GSC021_2756 [Leptospira noguchii str. 1993005606]|nr:hypothetical protein LEP1GSC021_2756 [Leptospira noguchii str. 1993005606]